MVSASILIISLTTFVICEILLVSANRKLRTISKITLEVTEGQIDTTEAITKISRIL